MADKPDGVWCRVCGKRHGYMTMTVNYEKRKTGWVILWICPVTGNVIGEQELSSDGQGSSQ